MLVSSDESDLKVSLLRNSERVNSKRVIYKKISQMLRCAHLSPCNMVHVPTASMAKKFYLTLLIVGHWRESVNNFLSYSFELKINKKIMEPGTV